MTILARGPLSVVIALLALTSIPSPARCDFIVQGSSSGALRYDRNGNAEQSYPLSSLQNGFYDMLTFSGLALSEDGALYQIGNDLGSLLFSHDVDTAEEFNVDASLGFAPGVPLQNGGAGNRPQVRSLNLSNPSDEVEVILTAGDNVSVFSVGTGELLLTVDPLGAETVRDFAILEFDTVVEPLLYFSTESGIYRQGVSLLGVFGPTSVVPNATGLFALRSQEELLLLDDASGDIDRYSLNGEFLGNFVATAGVAGDFDSVEVGPGGDVYVTNVDDSQPEGLRNSVLRFDGTTGALLQTTVLSGLFDFNSGERFIVLPVPEPSAAAMAVMASGLLLHRRRVAPPEIAC